MSDEVGRAKITVEADTSGVKASISDAKKDVQGFGDEAEASGSRASNAMEGFGDKTEGVASKLGKATGIVGAFAAAATGVVNAYKAIAEYVRNGETIAELFTADLDSVNATEAALDKINTKIQEVGSELAYKEQGGLGSLLGRSRKQIEEELESLRTRQRSISAQVRRQRQLEAEETFRAFKEQAKAVEDQALFSLLPDSVKIRESADIQKEALIQAAKEARVEIDDASLQSALDAIDRRADAELAKHREVVAEKERREKESADRQAKALAVAIERELASVTQSLFGTGGNSITTRLDTISKELKEVTSALGRR